MKESDLERKLVQGVKAQGGRAYKFVSPGNTGVPDRLVIWPRGRMEFVELKTETGRLSRVQQYQIDQLRRLGCVVRVLYGADDVQGYLLGWERGMRHGV